MKALIGHLGGFKVAVAALLAVLALLAARELSETLVSSEVPTPEERLEEKIRHFRDVTGPNKLPEPSQEEIDAERERLLGNFQTFQANYASWVDEFENSGVDVRSLRWEDAEFDLAPPPATIDEAVRQAKLIVTGLATSVDFQGDLGFPAATVQFRVEEVLAGSPTSSIEVRILGGPWLESGEAIMQHSAPTPMLLPGDRAVLILLETIEIWPVLAWGVARIEDDLVKLPQTPGAPLTQAFHDVPVADYLTHLKEVIARNTD